MIATGGKLFEHCAKCGKMVQLNKFLIGSLHICVLDGEDDLYAELTKPRYYPDSRTCPECHGWLLIEKYGSHFRCSGCKRTYPYKAT